MSIPNYETLMLPLLRRVADIGEAHIGVLVENMANDFQLTEAERGQLLPSGRMTVIRSRCAWARTYLVHAGLLDSVRRGVVRLTDRGRQVMAASPSRIDNAYLIRFPEFVEFRRRSRDQSAVQQDGLSSSADGAFAIDSQPALTPAERLEAAERELSVQLASDLLMRVRGISPDAFEQLIVDLLVRLGYGGSHREAAQRLGKSGDGGIDGIIREDALGLDAIYIQAKRYAEDNAVGAPVVQGFAGALLGHGATKGVFVTTSRFTAAARAAAASFRTHRIVLIDGDELARLMIANEIGVRIVQTMHVHRIDLEAYEEDDA